MVFSKVRRLRFSLYLEQVRQIVKFGNLTCPYNMSLHPHPCILTMIVKVLVFTRCYPLNLGNPEQAMPICKKAFAALVPMKSCC